jgi:hypothetical protein
MKSLEEANLYISPGGEPSTGLLGDWGKTVFVRKLNIQNNTVFFISDPHYAHWAKEKVDIDSSLQEYQYCPQF